MNGMHLMSLAAVAQAACAFAGGALLSPVRDAEVALVKEGESAFCDRAFKLTGAFAKRLDHQPFLCRTIEGGFSADVLKDGELVVVTPTAKSGALSQGAKL